MLTLEDAAICLINPAACSRQPMAERPVMSWGLTTAARPRPAYRSHLSHSSCGFCGQPMQTYSNGHDMLGNKNKTKNAQYTSIILVSTVVSKRQKHTMIKGGIVSQPSSSYWKCQCSFWIYRFAIYLYSFCYILLTPTVQGNMHRNFSRALWQTKMASLNQNPLIKAMSSSIPPTYLCNVINDPL